jgi:hypothetical protein
MSGVFERLSSNERLALWDLYAKASFRSVLRKPGVTSMFQSRRRDARFGAACPGKAVPLCSEESISLKVTEVSLGGMRAHVRDGLVVGQTLVFKIAIADFEIARLVGKAVWRNGSRYGFQIIEASSNWAEFIRYLSDDLTKPDAKLASASSRR